jgi:hypothetical protein
MDKVYVVCDASGEYVRDEAGEKRTPASDEAYEFASEHEAKLACTRATDKVLSRDVD